MIRTLIDAGAALGADCAAIQARVRVIKRVLISIIKSAFKETLSDN